MFNFMCVQIFQIVNTDVPAGVGALSFNTQQLWFLNKHTKDTGWSAFYLITALSTAGLASTKHKQSDDGDRFCFRIASRMGACTRIVE